MVNTQLILGPIIGGLSESHVNLWARASGAGVLHAWLGRKKDFSDAALAGKSLELDKRDGFAGVVPLDGLKPETVYHYALTLGRRKPSVPDGKFTTFPKDGKLRDFNFAFGSCFRPAKSVDGVEKGGLIFQNLEAQRVEMETDPEHPSPLRFVLLMGDQIYSDDRKFNGLGKEVNGKEKIALDLNDYRRVYEYTWSNSRFRNLLKNLPAFMTLDDHEVDDDWCWMDASRQKATFSPWTRAMRWLAHRPLEERQLTIKRVQDALKAYWDHQVMHAPPLIRPPLLEKNGRYDLGQDVPGSLAYKFMYGAAAFFVLDTRTMRVKGPGKNRMMLGDEQWDDLTKWLLDVKDKYPVKFLVSSSSVLYTILGDFLGDRWSGFKAERDRLLRFIGENGIKNLYILAGDLHSAHYISAQCGSKKKPVRIREYCSTPFEQQCNRLACIMYTPVLTGTVQKPRRHYVVTEPNYGVVRVHFEGNYPKVEFQLYGTDGAELPRKKNPK